MRWYLPVQFCLVAAGVVASALAGQISGIAWALCASYFIWREKRARDRADMAEAQLDAIIQGLAVHNIYVTIEERK